MFTNPDWLWFWALNLLSIKSKAVKNAFQHMQRFWINSEKSYLTVKILQEMLFFFLLNLNLNFYSPFMDIL